MTLEIEVKIKINMFELKEILDLLNFEKELLQKNIIYSFNTGFFRIRSENDKTYFTHKGERIDFDFNCRDENEICINYNVFEECVKFFNFLGEGFYYEKKRRYSKKNNCIICIDKLSNKEIFIEIEGSKKDIKKNLKEFNLINKEVEFRNYQDILKNI